MNYRAGKFFTSIKIDPEKQEKLRRGPKAQKQLVIYFTPRSGSSWLTETLSLSNCLGRANEVFNPNFIPNIAQSCNATSLDTYIDLIQRRLNTRGVFSFEITWHQLQAVFDDTAAFMSHFGAAQSAWLIRRDIVAQAVSLAKMVKTNVAHSPTADAQTQQHAEASFVYDPVLIRRWLTHILAAERGTEAHFAEYELSPLRLTYEDIMAAGAERTRAEFAEYIGIREIPNINAIPKHSKLGTSQNIDFAVRFRQDEAMFVQDVEEERMPWLAQNQKLKVR